MKIASAFSVNAGRDAVWDFLMNTENLAACMPGCESVQQLSEETYQAEVSVQISFMKLKFKVAVEIKEMQFPSFLRSEAEGSPVGVVGKVKLDSLMNLVETESGTRVEYEMDIRLTGKLGSLGQSIFRSKSEELGLTFGENVRARLETGEVAIGKATGQASSGPSLFTRILEKLRSWFTRGGKELQT